jgi:cystathionine gamma-synthase
MTHAAMPPEARAVAGIGDGLLRISVGIEDPRDLCADIEAALARVQALAESSTAATARSAIEKRVGEAGK